MLNDENNLSLQDDGCYIWVDYGELIKLIDNRLKELVDKYNSNNVDKQN